MATHKILFLVPPVVEGQHPAERSSGCTRVVYPTPNIYELQVAACVRDAGYDAAYWDCVNHPLSEEQLLERIKKEAVDIVLIWTVNLSVANDLHICRHIHSQFPAMWVLMLGPGAGWFYKDCLQDEHTLVVHGEPEMTVMEVLSVVVANRSLKDILGISYLQDGQIKRNGMRPLMKDLDALPIPARDLVADTDFRNPKLKVSPYTTMVTSRNCPFHCIYCVPSSLTFAREIENRHYTGKKPPIAFRSEEKVAEEIAMLHTQGYKAIGFVDDNFIWNEKRTRAICDALRKYQMAWSCQARADAITEPIAKKLGESGCQAVDLGVESFNDDILQFIRKGLTSQQIYQAINLLKKYRVPVKLNLLIGTSPLETPDTILDTIRKAKQLKADQLMINIVSPFPGTEFYTMAKDNGWIIDNQYRPTDVQKESILNYPHLSAHKMESLLFWGNLSYYLSPRFVFTQIRKFRSWKDFTHALKALKIKLFG